MLFWDKERTLAFFKTFYMRNGIQDFISTYFAMKEMSLVKYQSLKIKYADSRK